MGKITSNDYGKGGLAENWRESMESTIDKNRASNYERTMKQKELLKKRQLAQDKKQGAHCPNCKTTEKKYFKTKIVTPLDKDGNIDEAQIQFRNSCLNCGHGGNRKNPTTGVRNQWDMLKR